MALKGTLLWLCLLAVWSSSAAQDETLPQNCGSGNLAVAVREAAECGENLTLSAEETAALLLPLRKLSASLHKHQLKACQGAEPRECPEVEVPKNGGLACVTVANKRYCKPLCNDSSMCSDYGHQLKEASATSPKARTQYERLGLDRGYDFGFLRRSRLYEACSEQTGYKWSTQFIGGNKLAVCNEALIQVSGEKTAYFPKNQDCLTSKSTSRLQEAIIEQLTTELKINGIEGVPQHACLACG